MLRCDPAAVNKAINILSTGRRELQSRSRVEVHSVRIDQAPRVGRHALIFCTQRFEWEHAVAQKQQFNVRSVAIFQGGDDELVWSVQSLVPADKLVYELKCSQFRDMALLEICPAAALSRSTRPRGRFHTA